MAHRHLQDLYPLQVPEVTFRYKDGIAWYKAVLEIEWQSGIIVPCETVNRHLAGSERGRLSLCLKTAGLLTAAAVSRIESAQSKLTTKRTGLCD